jgi:hypothetical protein
MFDTFRPGPKIFISAIDKSGGDGHNPQQLAAVNTLMAEDAAEPGGAKAPPIKILGHIFLSSYYFLQLFPGISFLEKFPMVELLSAIHRRLYLLTVARLGN